MTRYAQHTQVPAHASRDEVEQILARYGATGFRYGWADLEAGRVEQIEFAADGRLIRFTLVLPQIDANEFKYANRKRRSEQSQRKRWEQACRQRWRALVLVVKAKLEAIETGITSFDQEFLSFVVNPLTKRTAFEEIMPQIDEAYKGIGGPLRLLGLPAPNEGEK